jgi:hypothetical protein
LFFNAGVDPSVLLKEVVDSGLQFPLIGKPDIGGGRGVKKLHTTEEMVEYA